MSLAGEDGSGYGLLAVDSGGYGEPRAEGGSELAGGGHSGNRSDLGILIIADDRPVVGRFGVADELRGTRASSTVATTGAGVAGVGWVSSIYSSPVQQLLISVERHSRRRWWQQTVQSDSAELGEAVGGGRSTSRGTNDDFTV